MKAVRREVCVGSFLEKVLLTKNPKPEEKRKAEVGSRSSRSSLQALLPWGAAFFGLSLVGGEGG